MERYRFRKIVYLDIDILVTESLGGLSKLLDVYPILLTPHLLEPMDNDWRPNELDIFVAGKYNFCFLAIADTEATRSFLLWWKSRLYDYCVKEPPKGLFCDQSWIDLALGFFDGIHILRDPGYNVAYWNMRSRKLRFVKQRFFVNGQVLRFFHFSGFDPDRPA